jgi:hypothetical protein
MQIYANFLDKVLLTLLPTFRPEYTSAIHIQLTKCYRYGTASEHSQLYQYQIHNAQNVFMGHIQTETP